MSRPSSAVPAHRRLGAACGALVLASGVGLVVATPAAAQTTTTTTTNAGATAASALRLTVNLPQGNVIQVDLDPVSGTVSGATGTGPQAEALATLLSGRIGPQAQSFPGAKAMLPEPKKASGPTNAVGDGINASPLGTFLRVGALTSSAEVTEAPSSTSTAQIADLDVGLPPQLAAALSAVLTPVLAGVDQVLAGIAPTDGATQAVCTGLKPVTVPVGTGVGGVPVLGEVLKEVVEGTLSPEQGVVCNLRATLLQLKDTLDASLASLSGPGGLLSTGLIGATQTITSEGAKTTSTATASIADLTVLGTSPFATARALTTTSTAVVDGATADATVDTTAVEAFSKPLLNITTDLRTITGDLTGIEVDGLTALLAQLQTVLDGLAGIGIAGGPLDPSKPAPLEACPEELGNLTGTFEAAPCAAAASRGFGLQVTLPAQLATPLGIAGPLVSVQLVPTAAVARAASSSVTTPVTTSLPRTGLDGAALGGLGVLLLVGAAGLRRRLAA